MTSEINKETKSKSVHILHQKLKLIEYLSDLKSRNEVA